MNYFEELEPVVSFALREDIGQGDISAALVPESKQAKAELVCREAAVICGRPWFDEVFRQLDSDIRIQWLVEEGDRIEPGSLIARLSGPARPLLTGERTALNFLQTLSATATAAAGYLSSLPPGLRLKDTRKTLPCLRRAQKYAVVTGGCENHRMGLFDAFLIKENHIAACGSIGAAIRQARELKPEVSLEVETENLEEVRQALEGGADIIMLDNFADQEILEAAALIDGRAEIEVSGNLDVKNLDPEIFARVDYISLGALTKHVQAVDLSLRINCEQG